MISINQKKLITSLSQKKYRLKHGLFLLEGDKLIRNALEQNQQNLVKIKQVWGNEAWINSLPDLPEFPCNIIQAASDEELNSLSLLVSAPGVLAIAEIPSVEFSNVILKDELTLVLDSIRDPGNMGNIIRTADWFGFKNIICSEDCVDAFNPKVVQASMGAVLRVQLYYESLPKIIKEAHLIKAHVFGTTMNGEDYLDAYIKPPALLVFGNESNGISPEVLRMLDKEIFIPGSSSEHSGSESLNVGSSLAIVCAEIRRRRK
jgi:RNA methyltransferase, TrmH family